MTMTSDLLAKSEAADAEIRKKHTSMPGAAGGEDAEGIRRKRLIYRAKQRGWLEVRVLCRP